MGRTTNSRTDHGTPRPVGQSFWLFTTMAIALVVVSIMGQALADAESSVGRQPYTSQELLDLADGPPADEPLASPTLSTVEASPAAPAVTEAAPVATTAVDTTDPLDGSTTTRATTGEPSSADSSDADSAGNEPNATEPTTDSGAETPEPTAPEGLEAQGQAALARISYPWQELLPQWTIVFLPEESGLYGLTKVPEERIEVYVRGDQSVGLLAHVIAHEIGHAVDVTLNSGPERRLWEDARAIDAPWWPGSGATDFSTGAGDFAESFAAWQVGEQSFRSKLGGAPTAAQIELLAQLAAG